MITLNPLRPFSENRNRKQIQQRDYSNPSVQIQSINPVRLLALDKSKIVPKGSDKNDSQMQHNDSLLINRHTHKDTMAISATTCTRQIEDSTQRKC